MPNMRVGYAYHLNYDSSDTGLFYLPLEFESGGRPIGILIDPTNENRYHGRYTIVYGRYTTSLSYNTSNTREIPREMFLGVLATFMENLGMDIISRTGAIRD